MKIKAYLKPHCGWSRGVRAIFDKYDLQYEDIDVVNHPENYQEMVQKSGQRLSPCIEINGTMLADISGEEMEMYMLENGLVQPNDRPVTVSINSSCSKEEHAAKAKAAREGGPKSCRLF